MKSEIQMVAAKFCSFVISHVFKKSKQLFYLICVGWGTFLAKV